MEKPAAKINPHEFWKWAFSDFMSNTLRGVLAEYIVTKAAGCTGKNRVEWSTFDLETASGLKIEVKSSAYLQTWNQKEHSKIRFDIGEKIPLDESTNTYPGSAVRAADVYVFCVLSETDKHKANPLDLDQWFFLVCPTAMLNKSLGRQKSVSLTTLEKQGLPRLSFDQLAAALPKVSGRTEE